MPYEPSDGSDLARTNRALAELQVDCRVLEERVSNFTKESLADRQQIHKNQVQLREQTHEWMQAMLNRLPPWAVWSGMAAASAIGAMSMFILTHK